MDKIITGQKPLVAQIIISFDGSRVGVSAPMENKMLCFGMIEIAKQIIAGSVVIDQTTPIPEKPLEVLTQ